MAEAKEKRDQAFDHLAAAVDEVDRVHDQIVADYRHAEDQRLR